MRIRTLVIVGVLALLACWRCGPRVPGTTDVGDLLAEVGKPNTTPSQFVVPKTDADAAKSGSDTLLLFVHGIFGDTLNTWQRKGRSPLWDYVLSQPSRQGHFDAYAFGFQTSMFQQGSINVGEAANILEREMSTTKFSKYKRIIVVAHSLGGLVAFEALTRGTALADRVGLVVTFATPYLGTQSALIGRQFLPGTGLEAMFPENTQNIYLQTLSDRWKIHKTKVRTMVVCGYESVGFPAVGVIVPRGSGIALCDLPASPIAENHIGIVKPSDEKHGSIAVLNKALEDYGKLLAVPPRIVLMDSKKRTTAQTQLNDLITGHWRDINVEPFGILRNWQTQSNQVASGHPAMVIVHWHALRPWMSEGAAEEEVLRGLRNIADGSPQTRLVIFSLAFSRQSMLANKRDIARAAARIGRANPELAERYRALALRIEVLPWSANAPQNGSEVERLFEMIDSLF